MFGATGMAWTQPILSDMYRLKEIGLVNKALSEIYRQVPEMDKGQYALVNVVSDLHEITTTETAKDMYGNVQSRQTLKEGLHSLSLRADVIRILSSARHQDRGRSSMAMNSKEKIYVLDSDSDDFLAHDIIASLHKRGLLPLY